MCDSQAKARESLHKLSVVYTIDGVTMGANAFSEGRLKDLLESKSVAKLCYRHSAFGRRTRTQMCAALDGAIMSARACGGTLA